MISLVRLVIDQTLGATRLVLTAHRLLTNSHFATRVSLYRALLLKCACLPIVLDAGKRPGLDAVNTFLWPWTAFQRPNGVFVSQKLVNTHQRPDSMVFLL